MLGCMFFAALAQLEERCFYRSNILEAGVVKKEERKRALELRKQGNSINKISQLLGVSKGSVSLWVREVALDAEQKQKLKNNSRESQLLASKTMSKKYEAIRQKHFDEGYILATKDEMFRLLCSLYWGEGKKNPRDSFQITNSDPTMIVLLLKLCLNFSRKPPVLEVTAYLNNGLDAQSILNYWYDLLGTSLTIKFREQQISRAANFES